jgi:hypothetical protein
MLPIQAAGYFWHGITVEKHAHRITEISARGNCATHVCDLDLRDQFVHFAVVQQVIKMHTACTG